MHEQARQHVGRRSLLPCRRAEECCRARHWACVALHASLPPLSYRRSRSRPRPPLTLARALSLAPSLPRPDEADCQIKCGDEFSNDVVGDFTKCAVTSSTKSNLNYDEI